MIIRATHDLLSGKIPFIRASQPPFLSVGEFFFNPRADSLIDHFLLSKCIAKLGPRFGEDTLGIRVSGKRPPFAPNLRDLFAKSANILSSWRQGGVSDAAWRPFRFFFCAFSRSAPRGCPTDPRAGDPSVASVARRAPLHDARSRPASLHGASASMDSEAAILRWLEPDETGACLSRGRAGFSRPRALVVPRAAQPRPPPSRFERALTPSPPRAPVASLPQAPRSSRAC